MEKSVDMLVVALCADYWRREEAVRARSVSHRTEMEYRYYNFNIFDAAAEVVGEHFAEGYIGDIGERRGYAVSELADHCCEKSYKMRKFAVKKNIAERLHLIDG